MLQTNHCVPESSKEGYSFLNREETAKIQGYDLKIVKNNHSRDVSDGLYWPPLNYFHLRRSLVRLLVLFRK